jgi:4-hydroxy-tetrahydrodipicolinate synthase
MQTVFEGVWVPIVTPFAGGAVDIDAQARLARHLSAQGAAGLVVGATTGEGSLLSPDELERSYWALRQAVPGLPLVLGLNEAATERAVALARRLAELRPDGLLVTPPTYLRPSQAGIERHLAAVAQAADLPILVYNIPYRTGVTVELPTLQALARDPRVVGIKECGGSTDRLLRLVHETPLRVLSGDDAQNYVALCLGAHGAIAAAAHVHTALHVALFEAVRAGNLARARRLAVALQPWIQDWFAEPNPAPVKAWLAQEGLLPAADVRLPFLPASAALHERLREHRAALQAVAV